MSNVNINSQYIIDKLFTQYVYVTKLPEGFTKEFNRKVYEIGKEYQKNGAYSSWQCDTFTTLYTYPFLKDNPLFKDFLDIVMMNIEEFAKIYQIRPNLKLTCESLWINIAPTGEYQEVHKHGGSHFSVAYYVKTPQNCGNIIFNNLETFISGVLPVQQFSNLYSESYSYTAEESKLIIFRSNLLHLVEKNRSSEDRCSISANFSYL
jgi:uncharacterized protein (TIGR02466 family)